MKLDEVSIHAWIRKHEIKTEKGQPIEFDNHLFMFQPYADLSPKQVVYKAAQIGFTTLEILKSIHLAKNFGVDIIYTQPTDSDVSIFVGGKVNRIIKNNPILQEWTRDKDTVEQKKMGDGMIYFRGTFSKRAAISVTSDVNIHDEVDFSDQEVIGDYESRLQHSEYKWQWFFGHPSAPGVGVSLYWDKSDQKHWFITCGSCKKEQYMSWPESVDMERKIFVCKYCSKEITDTMRKVGRWVSKYKDKEFSGYWIPLLIAPWISAKYIIDRFHDKEPDFFYNRILGLPYVGSGNKVLEDDILGNVVSKEFDFNDQVVIGVDTGIYLRYVIGTAYGIFYYGQTKKYETIEKLIKKYDAVAVFDQGGDIIGVRELREKYPNKVFLCHYRRDRKTMQLINWGKDEESGNVIVDRNRMIQLLIDEFKKRLIPLHGEKKDYSDYWEHWDNIYRVTEENNLGVDENKWLRSGRDDWVHATVYWRVGVSRFTYGKGELFEQTSELDGIRKSPEVNPDQTITVDHIKESGALITKD